MLKLVIMNYEKWHSSMGKASYRNENSLTVKSKNEATFQVYSVPREELLMARPQDHVHSWDLLHANVILTTGHLIITGKCDIHTELHAAEKVGKDLVTKGLVFCGMELRFFCFLRNHCRVATFLFEVLAVAIQKHFIGGLRLTALETQAFAGALSQFSGFNYENRNEPLSWLSRMASVELVERSSAEAVYTPQFRPCAY